MSPLDILQLVGYSIGALLPLWMAIQLVSHRDRLTALERVLFALALTMGGWHTSNLFITLHRLFGLKFDRWTDLLRLADSVAVVSITFAYSFLLHVHLHLWASAHNRGLTRNEKIRVYLSYLPTIFLGIAIPIIWRGNYAPMFTKLSLFVLPFAFWIAYVLGLIAVTELLIARRSQNRSEQRIMRTLAASFIGVGLVIMAALALGFRQVRILVNSRTDGNTGRAASEPWVEDVLEVSRHNNWMPVEEEQLLSARGYRIAYPLRREDKIAGMLVVDTGQAGLTTDSRSVLELLADQVAIAIDDSRLVEENVRLEMELAESERLATLGQMAATVAHEIKNPLSAIKSIAQVMREDDTLSTSYARDLTLIVGETDRLSQSVTQLLSFARRESPDELPLRVNELVRSVVELFQASANEQGIAVEVRVECDKELSGKAVAAIRDALSNLLLNALQSARSEGAIKVSAELDNNGLLIVVQDNGPGVTPELRERIWEPFFTTRQRGTGLGLAIVRKRMQEAGGSALLAASQNGTGARFELRLPGGPIAVMR